MILLNMLGGTLVKFSCQNITSLSLLKNASIADTLKLRYYSG